MKKKQEEFPQLFYLTLCCYLRVDFWQIAQKVSLITKLMQPKLIWPFQNTSSLGVLGKITHTQTDTHKQMLQKPHQKSVF